MARKQSPKSLTVALLSAHPMVLAEWADLAARPGVRTQSCRVESTLPSDLRRMSVPRAAVYLIDTLGPRNATETLAGHILGRHPSARLIAVAEQFSETTSFPLLRIGVKGLLVYKEVRAQLPQALDAVARGGYWVPRALLSRFVEAVLNSKQERRWPVGMTDLSPREQQVLDALLQNLSNKEIASKLFISERTAKFHVSNLLSKFGVRRRADLIMLHFQGEQGRA